MPRPELGTYRRDLEVGALQGSVSQLTSFVLVFSALCLLLLSFLAQGRPLREQQEVAAAVIQRCYRKYKQVMKEVKCYETRVSAMDTALCKGNCPTVPPSMQ